MQGNDKDLIGFLLGPTTASEASSNKQSPPLWGVLGGAFVRQIMIFTTLIDSE